MFDFEPYRAVIENTTLEHVEEWVNQLEATEIAGRAKHGHDCLMARYFTERTGLVCGVVPTYSNPGTLQVVLYNPDPNAQGEETFAEFYTRDPRLGALVEKFDHLPCAGFHTAVGPERAKLIVAEVREGVAA